MRHIVGLILGLYLMGCSSAPQRETIWLKPSQPNLLAEAIDKDKRECNYDAQKVFYANINSPLMGRYLGEQTFEACMKARGYTAF